MANQLSSFRRFPAAFAIVAGSALAFTGLMASTTPAYAQTGSDYRCSGLAEQAYTASNGVEGGKQASANCYEVAALGQIDVYGLRARQDRCSAIYPRSR